MSQAVSSFITDLAVHFGRKHDTPEAEEAWLKSMFTCMRGYSSDTLKRAAQRIINQRTERSFPLPAECKKVCDDIASQEAAESSPRLVGDKLPPFFSEDRTRLADDLIMCPLGREAAKDGWIGALHDFARENGRFPAGHEISKCMAVAKGFDDAIEHAARGECGELTASLLKLGKKMLARREALRQRVLGGAA